MVLLVSSGKLLQEITAGIDNLVDECNQDRAVPQSNKHGVSMLERTSAHTQCLN